MPYIIHPLISMDGLQGTKAYKYLNGDLNCKCFFYSLLFFLIWTFSHMFSDGVFQPWLFLLFLWLSEMVDVCMWDSWVSGSWTSDPPDIAKIILSAFEKQF